MNRNSLAIIRGSTEVAGAEVLSEQRASDTDRDRVITLLGEYYRDGYITGEVFHARMTAAAASPTRTRLASLLADLPAPPVPRHRPWHRPFTKNVRRWLHIGSLTISVLWGAFTPLALMELTGISVVYGSGQWAWNGTVHPAWATLSAYFAAFTGTVAFIASLLFYLSWELDQ